jgi:hypothetical protein
METLSSQYLIQTRNQAAIPMLSKQLRPFALLFVVILVAFIVTIASALQNLPPDRQIEFWARTLANILGTVIGATLAFWFAIRQFNIQTREAHTKSLTDTAFELHREFNNSELSKARSKGDKILTLYPLETLDVIETNHPEGETQPVYLVVRFYQRLWLAIKYDRINSDIVPDLFGEIFYWWYCLYFESQLIPIGWQVCRDMQDLKNWFDEHSNRINRQSWLDNVNLEKKHRASSKS